MLTQAQHRLEVETRGRGFVDLTDRVNGFLREAGAREGLVTAFCMHTSASLLVQENADPSVRRDLERFFSALVRDGDPRFEHADEGPDDMSAHVRAALTSVQVSVPVAQGALTLGTWQALYLWEHHTAPHHRQVMLHFVGTRA
jgi:secondary thiamine-phosphate synthase enzyme